MSNFSHDSLHPSIAKRLVAIENDRRALLATSAYANRVQGMYDEFMAAQGKDENGFSLGVRGGLYIYAKSFQMWLYSGKSYKDIAPLLRALMQDDWKIVPFRNEDGIDTRFEKSASGFEWKLIRNVRDGFDIRLTIALDMLVADQAQSDSCVRVQVGEAVVPESRTPIYEVICPGGVSNAS